MEVKMGVNSLRSWKLCATRRTIVLLSAVQNIRPLLLPASTAGITSTFTSTLTSCKNYVLPLAATNGTAFWPR